MCLAPPPVSLSLSSLCTFCSLHPFLSLPNCRLQEVSLQGPALEMRSRGGFLTFPTRLLGFGLSMVWVNHLQRFLYWKPGSQCAGVGAVEPLRGGASWRVMRSWGAPSEGTNAGLME